MRRSYLALLIVSIVSLLLSGCAGVSSSLRVSSDVLPPSVVFGLANELDKGVEAVHYGIVGSKSHGKFTSAIEAKMDRRGRVVVETERIWDGRR